MNLMLNLLFSMNYEDTRLTNAIIFANRKPISLYSYYISPAEFESSIYCRNQTPKLFTEEQAHCHDVYTQTYGGGNSTIIMEKILTGLMVKYSSDSDELIFEDVEPALEGTDPFPA